MISSYIVLGITLFIIGIIFIFYSVCINLKNCTSISKTNMKNKQIEWKENKGYYKNKLLFFIVKGTEGFYLYFLANRREVMIMDYTMFKNAKRGAERFLKRLQDDIR